MPNSDQLDEIIRRERTQITNKFLEATAHARNEREFQTAATGIIASFAELAGVDLSLREEYTLFNGRADAVYNRFIIEYEAPGSLRETNDFGHNKHAIGQVKEYLEKLVRRERHKAERLAGVVFNGNFFIWVRQRESSWYIDKPIKVDPTSTERFLRTLCSLSTERALIPENLVEDFGEKTNASRRVLPTFYSLLTNNPPRKTEVFFKQWAQQFSEVCDYDQASKVDVAAHARAYGITDKKVDAFRFFFCIHTYYAFLIKLLAVQIVHFYLAPKLGTDLRQAAAKTTEELKRYLQTMEDGGVFSQLGINNLFEGDFFRWYLDVWGEPMDAAAREIVNTLANYAVDTLDIDPDSSRDLLKHLYQDLMPKVLRHNLGEYYTPDWLAERTLGLLDGIQEETVRTTEDGARAVRVNVYRGDPKKRLLDPACGSGTFLVMAIRRIKEFAWKNSIPEREVLSLILSNVVGFDLNPLAVISARTNYLLALGDLMQHRGDRDINIPVYLCDSVLMPSEGSALHDKGVFEFSTSVGLFRIPATLVNAKQIDDLASFLEESVCIRLSESDFEAEAAERFALSPSDRARDVEMLSDLFRTLRKLDDEKINGIWARIIKNAFAPLFVGRFDLVAGNPPWINWEHLPEHYRRSIVPLWQKYDLFRHTGLKARLGGAKDDISILMFYVAVDRYLVPRGRIGFVITQTVFKTEGGGEGFRRLRCGSSGSHVRVLFVDDWSTLKPFEGAANKTAVVIAQRDLPTRYPVPVAFWRKRAARTSLPEDAPLEKVVYELCRQSQWAGSPVSDQKLDSPWITGRPKSLRPIKRILGKSEYKARAGICTWLNGVYWADILAKRPDGLCVVGNRGDVGKKKQESIECAIEGASIYSLLRGENIGLWTATPELHIILAVDEQAPAKAMSERQLKRERPKTFAFFAQFRDVLEKRSGYKKYLSDAPFYSVYNIGPYTFSPYKVVWREQASLFTAAVVTSEQGRTVVPDHKLMLVPCRSEQEAYFVCGCLTSSLAQYIVASYAVSTSITTHVLNYVPVPQFDTTQAIHQEIALICSEGHKAVASGDSSKLRECRQRVDERCSFLWRISNDESKDITRSLAEMGSATVRGRNVRGESDEV